MIYQAPPSPDNQMKIIKLLPETALRVEGGGACRENRTLTSATTRTCTTSTTTLNDNSTHRLGFIGQKLCDSLFFGLLFSLLPPPLVIYISFSSVSLALSISLSLSHLLFLLLLHLPFLSLILFFSHLVLFEDIFVKAN